MPNSATDTVQKLAEAIAYGDVEGALALLAAFQGEVLNGVTAAASPLEREVLLAEAIRSTPNACSTWHDPCGRYANGSLRETNCAIGYSASLRGATHVASGRLKCSSAGKAHPHQHDHQHHRPGKSYRPQTPLRDSPICPPHCSSSPDQCCLGRSWSISSNACISGAFSPARGS